MKRSRLWAVVAACAVVGAVLVSAGPAPAATIAPTLTQVTSFGPNPTNLTMDLYVPARLAQQPAILVAMHDCGSSAQAYFDGAAHDFVTAADQYGFLIVFPEATRAGGCFDVSSQAALTRGGGSDPVGIMSMVRYTRMTYHAAANRIFATGVSSGAMMTTVLAAEYPDVLAAGSAFSGAPAGCMASAGEPTWNSQCASGQIVRTPQEWGDLARAMYPGYQGRYPRMQLWHGTADTTVAYGNLGESVKQWTNLGQLDASSPATDNPEPGWTRARYGRTDNLTQVEAISVAAAGHTLPQHLMVAYAIAFFGLDGSTHGRHLPSAFHWTSSDILISPKSDATHAILAVKDPSVVRYAGQWLVYATTVDSAGHYNMEYLTFRDWKDAPNATPYYLDQSAIGPGYRAAPELFYFQPQGLWYLIYQSGDGATYSTTTDPTKPETWSAPKPFFSTMPDIIQQNIGKGHWVDMWVICDETACYLFSSDDNGHLYRSQTTLADFPNGFSNTVIALDSPTSKFRLFEASNVYRVRGTDTYMLIVEAQGNARYFRTWTSNRLDGMWTPLAGSELNPFASASNVTFAGTPWTKSISHGEMIRDGYDQTLTVPPNHMQYLYQGVDPTVSASYAFLPWRLGLLTQDSVEEDMR